MPLSSGGKLGPYEIVSPIGAAKDGDVWKARDTRLARTLRDGQGRGAGRSRDRRGAEPGLKNLNDYRLESR
jgi:hypothetical protein